MKYEDQGHHTLTKMKPKPPKANAKISKPKAQRHLCRHNHNAFLKELNTSHINQQLENIRPPLPPKIPITIKQISQKEINESIDLFSKL